VQKIKSGISYACLINHNFFIKIYKHIEQNIIHLDITSKRIGLSNKHFIDRSYRRILINNI